eukprot:TRINITY_DN14924_c0_g1_i1.p1 TRINITY_DN14924_c0_g1~~TRINITY_DN14924_c0_g1_i1.p1  ORF type:complete len:460 (-),score=99.58 TRINITY_DN14924_c0_g1_i1:45-1424(-)
MGSWYELLVFSILLLLCYFIYRLPITITTTRTKLKPKAIPVESLPREEPLEPFPSTPHDFSTSSSNSDLQELTEENNADSKDDSDEEEEPNDEDDEDRSYLAQLRLKSTRSNGTVYNVYQSFKQIPKNPTSHVLSFKSHSSQRKESAGNNFKGCQRLFHEQYLATIGITGDGVYLHIVDLTDVHFLLESDITSIPQLRSPTTTRIKTEKKQPVGFQAVGDFLIMCFQDADESEVQVYHVGDSHPPQPYELEHLRFTRGRSHTLTLGMTELYDGFYLLVLAGSNQGLDFFVSSTTDLLDPTCKFNFRGSWSRKINKFETKIKDKNFNVYQNMNVLSQQSDETSREKGTVFIVGMYTSKIRMRSKGDFADLISVSYQFSARGGSSSNVTLTKIAKRNFRSKKSNFNTGAGLFVDGQQKLSIVSLRGSEKNAVCTFEEFRRKKKREPPPSIPSSGRLSMFRS